MTGTNATTGKALSGKDHLIQSIKDILSTPIGTRVMLREYGSKLFEYVDAPINKSTIIDMYVACIDALRKWEPRISVSQISIYSVVDQHITLSLSGTDTQDGTVITVDNLVV